MFLLELTSAVAYVMPLKRYYSTIQRYVKRNTNNLLRSQEGVKSSSLCHFVAVWFIKKQVSFLTILFPYSRRLLNTGACLSALFQIWKHRTKNSPGKGRVGLELPLFGIPIPTNPYRRQQYSAAAL